MIKRILLCFFLFFLASRSSAEGQEPALSLEGRYWFGRMEAQIQSGGVMGTEFDARDLGFEDTGLLEARLTCRTGENSLIRAFYTQAEYRGDRAISRTIVYEGSTYPAASVVQSDFDLAYCGLGWIWKPFNFFDARVRAGTIAEVKGISADLALHSPAMGGGSSEHFTVPFPSAGLVFECSPFDFLRLFAEASGLSAGRYGYFIDGEAGVGFSPAGFISFTGGYRLIQAAGDDPPDYGRVRVAGAFASAAIRF